MRLAESVESKGNNTNKNVVGNMNSSIENLLSKARTNTNIKVREGAEYVTQQLESIVGLQNAELHTYQRIIDLSQEAIKLDRDLVDEYNSIRYSATFFNEGYDDEVLVEVTKMELEESVPRNSYYNREKVIVNDVLAVSLFKVLMVV
jgi:hypothetical protein